MFLKLSDAFLASHGSCFAIGCIRWSEPHEDDFYSERVKIIFNCVYTTTNQIVTMASAEQNCDVRKHIVETVSFSCVCPSCCQLYVVQYWHAHVHLQWTCLMESSVTEVEWRVSKYVPTSVEEYMAVAHVSFGLGPTILALMYFLGINLPECVHREEEYNELLKTTSIALRLLNDIQTFEVFWLPSSENVQRIIMSHIIGVRYVFSMSFLSWWQI